MVVVMADCIPSLLVVESVVFIVFISIAGLQVATDDSNSECAVSDTHAPRYKGESSGLPVHSSSILLNEHVHAK